MKFPIRFFAALASTLTLAVSGFAQVTWSAQSPSGLTDGVWCVTYANSTFAAVTDQGKVLTSADGLAWSSETIAQGTWLVSIAYGNGTWVAVGANGTILVSSNLTNWISATAATTNRLNGVLYNGTTWVAVGEADTVLTSPDAINWTVQHVPSSLGLSGFLHGITWDAVNNVFLITGSQSGNNASPYGNYAGGEMLQLALSGSTATITQIIPPTASPLEAVLYESGVTPNTVVVGDSGTVFSGSYNVSSPTYGTVPNVVYRGLAYGSGYWIAAGEQGTIVTSMDGINWTQRFSGNSPSTVSTATLLGATYSSTLQRFVVVGLGGTILVSNATASVLANVSTRGFVNGTQTQLIGGFVIEGNAPRTVVIRAVGPTLANYLVANPLPDPVLTVYNASGVVVATNTGWSTNSNASAITTADIEVGAFPLPSSSADSALLLTLQPGGYTAVITSAKGNSGTALFETYAD